MSATALDTYDPHTFRALTFHDVTPRFRNGTDTPRAYLERCLETIAAREPVVQAFAALNEAGARAAADASTMRWQAGRPLSAIDGLPIGIKDLLETRDLPTQMGCAGRAAGAAWPRALRGPRPRASSSAHTRAPVRPAPAPSPAPPPEGWCALHQVQMERRSNERGSWWSHRLADGSYCKGK